MIGMSRSEVLMGIGFEGGMTTERREAKISHPKRKTRKQRQSKAKLTFLVKLMKLNHEGWGLSKERGQRGRVQATMRDSLAIPLASSQQAERTVLRSSSPRELTWQLDKREGTEFQGLQPRC